MSRWKWIGRPAVVAVYVMAVTYMDGKWAIRCADLERGYVAVGGEYIFIPMVAWVAGKVINLFFDALEENDRESRGNNKTGSRDIAEMQDNG